jgi:hypothetical protein
MITVSHVFITILCITKNMKLHFFQMVLQDPKSGQQYSFELKDRIIRADDIDGWREIPVKSELDVQPMNDENEMVEDENKETESSTLAKSLPGISVGCNKFIKKTVKYFELSLKLCSSSIYIQLGLLTSYQLQVLLQNVSPSSCLLRYASTQTSFFSVCFCLLIPAILAFREAVITLPSHETHFQLRQWYEDAKSLQLHCELPAVSEENGIRTLLRRIYMQDE